MDENPLEEMVTGSYYAIRRAKHFLTRFDHGEEACLIHAALELRLALESLPLERLKGTGKFDDMKKEILDGRWNPSAFMEQLLAEAPRAAEPYTLRVSLGRSQGSLDFPYVPPPKNAGEQAKTLSKLLHAPFILCTHSWARSGERRGGSDPLNWTMDDWRTFLGEVLADAEGPAQSSLFSPPPGDS